MYYKIKKFIIRPLFVLLVVFSITVLGLIGYLHKSTPDSFSVLNDEKLNLNSKLPLSVSYKTDAISSVGGEAKTDKNKIAKLSLFNIFPVKDVNISVISSEEVLVLGEPFGIKIYTEGVLVVRVDTVDTERGNKSPAKDAGIEVGDYILTVGGKVVKSNEDVADLIEKSNGNKITFVIKRNNKKLTVSVTPELSYSTGKYKAGVWVKDSSAGIGTLTFYSPSLGVVAGLGHAVCDNDTGIPLSLDSGRLVTAEIVSVNKGKSGTPGGLIGRFTNFDLGNMLLNCDTGVYSSKAMDYEPSKLLKIALRQEITEGKAQILSTIDGGTPTLYDCEITKINHTNSITKNISIKITDKRLLEVTGGIVQGMSGSPLIQNGKLIGAVTHVLVDDPTRGYAIFAENMLETAQSVAEEKKLKEAS